MSGKSFKNEANEENAQEGQKASSGCGAKNIPAYPQEVVLAAATLALALSKGRSQYEIETLINLFSLTTNNLQTILAQILINKKTQDILETVI